MLEKTFEKTVSKSKKRSQLIDNALRLFAQQGIHAVGINEILATSGIAKKTLYNHFASKELLIQACVLERDHRFMNWFEHTCKQSNSASAFINVLFDALDDWINNRVEVLGAFYGCFFVNTAAEYSHDDSGIYESCIQHKENIKSFFTEQLSQYIDDTDELNRLIQLLLLLKEGVINCAHVMNDKQAAIKAKPLALSYLS